MIPRCLTSASSEEWRAVVGWDGYYEVSDKGRVRSVARSVPCGRQTMSVPERILSPYVSPRGYLTVALSRSGGQKTVSVHWLVLEAFVGPRPDGWYGCHNDGDALHNCLSNLRWDTPSSNVQDALRHGTHHWAGVTHCPRGHEYTPENTAICTRASRPGGGQYRICRTCARAAKRASKQRREAKRAAA